MDINELFHQYSLGKEIDYKSIDEETIKKLIDTIMNDKNSSTAREIVILEETGYKQIESKLDYDGIKDNDLAEVKLRNLDIRRLKNPKLNGEGSYSDYTWDRYKKHYQDNPTMLVGGFIDGKLMYIFKYKYQSMSFIDRIREKLTNYFGLENSERKPNTFLRSLSFNYTHYKDYADLVFVAPLDVLKNNENYFNKKLYKRLTEKYKE